MDGSFDVEAGLHIARRLLLDLVGMGLPLATEALDPNSPQYRGLVQLVGDRRAHHRIADPPRNGFRPVDAGRVQNGTDGSLGTAINAMRAAAMPHRFVGINRRASLPAADPGQSGRARDPARRQNPELQRRARCGL